MMCLAVPGQLIACADGAGEVEMHGNRISISTVLVPEARQGDWVLVHAGFAIQRLDEQEAMEVWAVVADLAKAEAAAGGGGE